VTFVEHRRPDGFVARWDSRRYRKHLKAESTAGSTWWAPGARGWWIAILFAVGSLLFALGALPGYADAVGTRWDAATFFIGSLFFTAAGFLTYREAVDAAAGAPGAVLVDAAAGAPGVVQVDAAAAAPGVAPVPRDTAARFFVFQPRRIDWWATAVQLAGTLFFNLSCGNALRVNLTSEAANQHVWRPDALGSICFLVASVLAWFEVCHGWVSWRPRAWSWWITLLNLVGSVAFGISAVAGYVNPTTGQLHNADRANLGTFVGALCFLVGALLLLPERTEADRGPDLAQARH
jgi:hypothetical protein